MPGRRVNSGDHQAIPRQSGVNEAQDGLILIRPCGFYEGKQLCLGGRDIVARLTRKCGDIGDESGVPPHPIMAHLPETPGYRGKDVALPFLHLRMIGQAKNISLKLGQRQIFIRRGFRAWQFRPVKIDADDFTQRFQAAPPDNRDLHLSFHPIPAGPGIVQPEQRAVIGLCQKATV